MDYIMFYKAWKKEKEDPKIQPLDKCFYAELSIYLKALKDEIELLDDKTLLAHLALEKQKNLEKIITDLIQIRYTKISTALFNGEQIPSNYLTSEEDIICTSISLTMNQIKNFTRKTLKGQSLNTKESKRTEKSKILVVRFLKDIPAIVGSNMKIYGPFKIEDVASLPSENAESLIKRGVAVTVEPQ
jgi:DNA replication factor GINS